jgi:hypothetical protein
MWHVWGTEVHRVLMGRPEGRSLLGRPRRRWDDNTKMDLQEMGWGKIQTGFLSLRTGIGRGRL